ncbi:hypothetical protein FB451DRAFT_1527218 [Mycena latifolia]|nr:hypothetical protein FB451DRAFT_1527218 [Mycena latifolia]
MTGTTLSSVPPVTTRDVSPRAVAAMDRTPEWLGRCIRDHRRWDDIPPRSRRSPVLQSHLPSLHLFPYSRPRFDPPGARGMGAVQELPPVMPARYDEFFASFDSKPTPTPKRGGTRINVGPIPKETSSLQNRTYEDFFSSFDGLRPKANESSSDTGAQQASSSSMAIEKRLLAALNKKSTPAVPGQSSNYSGSWEFCVVETRRGLLLPPPSAACTCLSAAAAHSTATCSHAPTTTSAHPATSASASPTRELATFERILANTNPKILCGRLRRIHGLSAAADLFWAHLSIPAAAPDGSLHLLLLIVPLLSSPPSPPAMPPTPIRPELPALIVCEDRLGQARLVGALACTFLATHNTNLKLLISYFTCSILQGNVPTVSRGQDISQLTVTPWANTNALENFGQTMGGFVGLREPDKASLVCLSYLPLERLGGCPQAELHTGGIRAQVVAAALVAMVATAKGHGSMLVLEGGTAEFLVSFLEAFEDTHPCLRGPLLVIAYVGADVSLRG